MNKRLWRSVTLIGLVVSLVLLPSLSLAAAGGGPQWLILSVDGVEARIFRDGYGVPHIFAPTNRALFYAYGYAIAQDRLWQLDVYRRTALGTLAEVMGSRALASDRHERLHGYTHAEYQTLFAALPGEAREILLAYRDGINAYMQLALDDPGNKLPWEFHQLGYLPAPWEVTDTLAISRFMANRFGESSGQELRNQALLQYLTGAHGDGPGLAMFNDLRWLNDPDAPVTLPVGSPGAGELPSEPLVLPGVDRIAADVEALNEGAKDVWRAYGVPVKLGSYAWAVSPSRSETGHAMLYGGPQMGFETPDVIHEVQLSGGQGLDIVGIAFAGTPLVSIGHNRELAWSITSGMGDNIDTYVVELNPANSEQYWYQGTWQTMITRTETISVTGTTIPLTQVVRRTVHGPVIALDEANGLAYALRRAHWMQEAGMFAALLDMIRAQNLAEFGQGMASFRVSNHVLYADTAGNIAYWQAGAIPIRPGGGHVGRLPWRGDGSEEWTGAWRPLPHIINPTQGYLANWNNKASLDFDNGDSVLLGKQDRVSDIDDLLAADDSISWEDMRAIARRIGTVKLLGNETRYLRAYLLGAIARLAPGDAQMQEVAARLAAWDGHFTPDAIGGTTLLPEETLWTTWLGQALLNTFSDELGSYWSEANLNTLLHALDGAASGVAPSRDYFDRINTPGHETADEILLLSLSEALDNLTLRFGTADIDAWLDTRPIVYYQHPLGPSLGQMPISNRATYAQIIELSVPIKAENILPLGQSAFISPAGMPSSHYGDQLPLYREFRYKPMCLVSLSTVRLPLLWRDG